MLAQLISILSCISLLWNAWTLFSHRFLKRDQQANLKSYEVQHPIAFAEVIVLLPGGFRIKGSRLSAAEEFPFSLMGNTKVRYGLSVWCI